MMSWDDMVGLDGPWKLLSGASDGFVVPAPLNEGRPDGAATAGRLVGPAKLGDLETFFL